MNLIKKVISFFKKIFNKEKDIKMLDASAENLEKDDKSNFIKSLKIKEVQTNKKKKVETLTCFGDGLGIQTKISY